MPLHLQVVGDNKGLVALSTPQNAVTEDDSVSHPQAPMQRLLLSAAFRLLASLITHWSFSVKDPLAILRVILRVGLLLVHLTGTVTLIGSLAVLALLAHSDGWPHSMIFDVRTNFLNKTLIASGQPVRVLILGHSVLG